MNEREILRIDAFFIKPPSDARAAYIRTDVYAQEAIVKLLLAAFGGRWPGAS